MTLIKIKRSKEVNLEKNTYSYISMYMYLHIAVSTGIYICVYMYICAL